MKKRDDLYMDMAIRLAKESKCPRKKVGCVLLLDSGMLSVGVNGFPTGEKEYWTDGAESNPLVTHAEMNTFSKCLEQGVCVKNATLYVTMQPCAECSKIIVSAKIKRVVYLEEYRLNDGLEYLKKYGVKVDRHHVPELSDIQSFTQCC